MAENNIFAQIKGDFVLKAVYSFKHMDFLCFVTEFMVGGDLSKLLKEF